MTGAIGAGELWSYDLGGRPPIPLALPGNNFAPVWSPDGKQVAFARAESGSMAVFTLPADGSVLAPQPLATEVGAPKVWSATDELILQGFGGLSSADIAARPIRAAGETRQIVATDFLETDPALSPNGQLARVCLEPHGSKRDLGTGLPGRGRRSRFDERWL